MVVIFINSKFKKLIFLILILISFSTTVKAYIPVAYSCCKNYTYNDGVLLDGFDNEDIPNGGIQLDHFQNLTNWTITGGSQTADTVNFMDGTQGLKLIATNGSRASTDKIINNNFSTTINLGFWVYVYNSTTLDGVTIYITSNGTNYSTYFEADYWGLTPGWNHLVIPKSQFYNNGGENWNNIMNKIRIASWPSPGQSTSVTFDELNYNIPGNWTVGGTGASTQADTINFKEGIQGLKLIAINGSSAFIDKEINENDSNVNNFVVWVYLDNVSNSPYVMFYLTSNNTNFSTFFSAADWGGFRTGWNELVFSKNSFSNFGGENWNNILTKMRFRIGTSGTANLNVTFDDLRRDMMGQKAKLMIDFDDGLYDTVANAYPILKANNQTGTSFVVTSYIGWNGFLNLTNLQTLQAGGWDISSHTIDHPFLSSLDDINLSIELNGSYDWLVSNNFQKTAGFIAYPYGDFNDNVLYNTEKKYLIGRGTIGNVVQQHYTNDDDSIKYIERIIGMTNTTTVQSVEDSINDTINSRLLEILVFHDIANSNPTGDANIYLKSDFQKISNYIKSRSNDIDVITRSDYVIPIIHNFTPVINKKTRIYSNGSSLLLTNNKYDEYMPNMTIIPSSDSIDIVMIQYNETNGSIRFNESSSNGSLQVSYNIGDRIPNQLYAVKIYWANGTIYQNLNVYANDTGYINYNSIGFGSPRYQKIDTQIIDTSFTVTLPMGYTYLRFNATNSTVNNLNPDGQNSSQPFFNISNNGNIRLNYSIYLNNTAPNITTYAVLSNNFSSGRIPINRSKAIIINGLTPGNSQNVWMVIDADRSSSMNVNNTLTINSSI